jgi:hypothetical protein
MGKGNNVIVLWRIYGRKNKRKKSPYITRLDYTLFDSVYFRNLLRAALFDNLGGHLLEILHLLCIEGFGVWGLGFMVFTTIWVAISLGSCFTIQDAMLGPFGVFAVQEHIYIYTNT